MDYPKYDVAIIGLGPAGAALAGFLDARFRVIAIDKKGGKQGFHKPCGGLLAPDAQKSLAQFHWTLPLEILVNPQIFSVRTLDVKNKLVRFYQRHYVNLDRNSFDEWLISRIPAHIEVRKNALCEYIEAHQGGYLVRYAQNGTSETIFAKFLVGADGANSVVRKTLFPKIKMRSYLCIQQWFSGKNIAPSYACVFDPDSTDCYAWGLTKNRHFIFGGAFPVKTAKKSFESLKEKLTAYGFGLASPLKTEACLILRPRGPFSFCTGKNGAFLVGEAAGFVSPSSLEGISYALDSGYLLSTVLGRNPKNPNQAYSWATLKMKAKLIFKNIKSIFMYQPLLRKLIMKSGIGSIAVLPPHSYSQQNNP